MNALNVNLTAEEIFRTNLVNLGNETKRRLIELLASSMSFVATDSKSNDKKLLNRIAGAWCDDVTADEEIAVIRNARAQGVTRNIIDL